MIYFPLGWDHSCSVWNYPENILGFSAGTEAIVCVRENVDDSPL